MEGYLRLALILMAATILFLIFFERWQKRRRLKVYDPSKAAPRNDFFNEANEPRISALSFSPTALDRPVSTVQTKSTPEKIHDDHLIVMSVIAKPDNYFASYDLFQAISSTGMQFGEMNIFHFYSTTAQGRVTLFSLASATEPGEFDIDNMGDYSCAGLTLFMNVETVAEPERAFELMLKTAQQLADDLDGELRAGQCGVWDQDVLREYRRKVVNNRTCISVR